MNPSRFALQKKFTRRAQALPETGCIPRAKIGFAMAALGPVHNKEQL